MKKLIRLKRLLDELTYRGIDADSVVLDPQELKVLEPEEEEETEDE